MLKKTILACVLLHLVVGTISLQKIDSIDIKSMRAYYKQYFNDPTDPIVLRHALRNTSAQPLKFAGIF